MIPEQQQRFDSLVEDAIESLPQKFRDYLEEVPVVVLDEPTIDILRDLGIDPGDQTALDEMCGLHTGIAMTDRSVADSDLPPVIHLFRRGIVALAGGWDTDNPDEEIYEEVRTTLLHEIGHHFGLDEDDLDRLGYA